MGPSVFSIPPHRSFSDALAVGLISSFGQSPTGLAGGIVLLPNNRAVRAVTEAFVRHSGSGLLPPRLVAIGDEDIEERIGGMLDPISAGAAVPPAIDPMERLMLLARLVQRHGDQGVDAAEAMRLAQDLARTLDQMLIEGVEPARLREVAASRSDLSEHWNMSLDRLEIILSEWPRLLAARGRTDLSQRRNLLLGQLAARWRRDPPGHFVVGAGVSISAPAVAGLLRTIADLPNGMGVFAGLDLALDDEPWDELGPHTFEDGRPRRRSIETHPQFQLKLLLDRMSVARAEVRPWRWGGGKGAPAARSRAIANAMLPAAFTSRWQSMEPADRRLSGVRALEVASPAEEAQVIAVALREALEVPERTAALVTPERGLARRVSAHLRRWGIEADDSAGRPLSELPAGTLLLALARAAAEGFAPVPLLTLLKHPLVMKGEGRLQWLEGARLLDLALRGPRPPAGLGGIDGHLADTEARDARVKAAAFEWWIGVRPRLAELERAFVNPGTIGGLILALREAASDLSQNEAWAGQAGRQASDLLAEVEAFADEGPHLVRRDGLVPLLELLLRGQSVRPPYGQHPRIFIWGLIEAQLQHADLMILGGLNEGVWPALPSPDPWLAPRIRTDLGLPGLERRIGLAALDFSLALGAQDVLITRARRDSRSPTVASRFWLRLEAMTGGITRAPLHRQWAVALDRPERLVSATRPAPAPDPAIRPRRISVTEVDRLKADPFAFYARRMLGLAALDPIDAEPSAAWRGSAVHKVLESWFKEDRCDPELLAARAESLLETAEAHPLMRALWKPRLMEAIQWVADEMLRGREQGREPVAAEIDGKLVLQDIELRGVADRIDRDADGALVIVDYKTGKAPSTKAVAGGFAMQLGLLGLMAERGGFAGLSGKPLGFEYWSLARGKGGLGHIASPVGGRGGLDVEDFTMMAERNFIDAAARWLTGDEPFTAKLHPEYAPYGDYDQLMRLDEWYGREAGQET